MSRLIRTIILFILLPLVCNAAPSISSVNDTTLQHGQTITISGSEFGAHADYNNIDNTWQGKDFLPFRWKDFEDGVFESDGIATDYDDGCAVINAGAHAGTYYGQVTYEGNRLIHMGTTIANATGTFYGSFWFMVGPGSQSGKFYRIYLGGDTADDHFLSTGCSDYYLRGGTDCGGATQWSSPNAFTPGSWHRIEVLTTASEGEMNVTTWMDGVQQWSVSDWCDIGYDPNGQQWRLCDMIDSPTNCDGADGSYNYDDIFMNNTQARVEIGNASTWAACTMREIQIPTSWSASSIAVTVNQGSFASDATAYLYVVDSTGAVNSSGYEITFGEEEDEEDTTAPTVTITTSDPQSVSTDSVSISWTDSDDTGVTSRKWRIGSAPDATHGTECTSPATITGLSAGANTVYIGAADAAGNWGSDSITVNYILTRKLGGNPPR